MTRARNVILQNQIHQFREHTVARRCATLHPKPNRVLLHAQKICDAIHAAQRRRVTERRSGPVACGLYTLPAPHILAAVMTPAQHAIVVELYIAMELLGAPPKLLGIIGSWGDSLGDEEVLDMLTAWNTTGDIELKPIPRRH